ncbi:MAG: PorV/PorQ family protein [Elusimicrobia bacterium]|nr:PorV/PorQ family protein [Elusimicrobiota bacterium]
MIKNSLLLVIIFSLLNAPSFASGPGTTSANFLKIPVGARQTALGSAFTAVADDVNAIYYNPGGLAQLDKTEITFVHNKYFEDISQQWFAGAFPAKIGVFGVGVNYLSVSKFDAYDNNNTKIDSVSAYDMAVNLSYAKHCRLLDNDSFESFSYGANLKYLSEKLDTIKSSGFGLDIGVLLKPNISSKMNNLSVAFAVNNVVSSKVKFINESYKLPLEFKTGIAYKSHPARDYWTTLSLDWNFPRDGQNYIAAGMENIFYELFALRVGYNSFGDISEGFNLGFGIRCAKFLNQSVEVDYSFSNTYDFGNIHKMGILYRFGSTVGPSPDMQKEKSEPIPPEKAG